MGASAARRWRRQRRNWRGARGRRRDAGLCRNLTLAFTSPGEEMADACSQALALVRSKTNAAQRAALSVASFDAFVKALHPPPPPHGEGLGLLAKRQRVSRASKLDDAALDAEQELQHCERCDESVLKQQALVESTKKVHRERTSARSGERRNSSERTPRTYLGRRASPSYSYHHDDTRSIKFQPFLTSEMGNFPQRQLMLQSPSLGLRLSCREFLYFSAMTGNDWYLKCYRLRDLLFLELNKFWRAPQAEAIEGDTIAHFKTRVCTSLVAAPRA